MDRSAGVSQRYVGMKSPLQHVAQGDAATEAAIVPVPLSTIFAEKLEMRRSKKKVAGCCCARWASRMLRMLSCENFFSDWCISDFFCNSVRKCSRASLMKHDHLATLVLFITASACPQHALPISSDICVGPSMASDLCMTGPAAKHWDAVQAFSPI